MKDVLLALHQQPIAVYPIYIDITGSMTAGVLLSQIMYWNSKMKGKEFYKSDAELMQETRLTQSEFKTAKKIIGQLSFLKIERKGAPFRTFYKVNSDELLVVLQRFSSSFTYELGSRLSTSQRGVNLRTIIGTENTQKNTTEITTIPETEVSVVLIEQDEELTIEVHHVPDYFDEEKPQKERKKKVGPKKKENPDAAPVNEMWEMYLPIFQELSGETPSQQTKHFTSLSKICKELRKRALEKNKLEPDLALWDKFLIEAKKVAMRPNESWLHDNFTPSVMWSQFDSILIKIRSQRGVVPLYREKPADQQPQTKTYLF